MIKKALSIALTTVAVATWASAPALAGEVTAGDAAAGEKIFKKKCAACHSNEKGKNKVGPSLYDVYGRKAGTAEGYTRYRGLKGADFDWDAATLNEWIENPKAFAKAHTKNSTSAMTFKLKNADQRADVIAYLKTLK